MSRGGAGIRRERETAQARLVAQRAADRAAGVERVLGQLVPTAWRTRRGVPVGVLLGNRGGDFLWHCAGHLHPTPEQARICALAAIAQLIEGGWWHEQWRDRKLASIGYYFVPIRTNQQEESR